MQTLMIENQIELIIIIGALIFSKSKLIPMALIIQNVLYQMFNNNSSERYDFYLERYYNLWVTLTKLNEELMFYYISNGAFMMLIALMFALLQTRMAMYTAAVIMAQSAVTILMSVVVYFISTGNEGLMGVFGHGDQVVTLFGEVVTYSSIEGYFVIMYCVIAWICVFLSRKSSL